MVQVNALDIFISMCKLYASSEVAKNTMKKGIEK